jgi:hypothetical protein
VTVYGSFDNGFAIREKKLGKDKGQCCNVVSLYYKGRFVDSQTMCSGFHRKAKLVGTNKAQLLTNEFWGSYVRGSVPKYL